MAEQQIRFTDGPGYERVMGIWSRSVGEVFLDWLAPPQGTSWVDVGCGNGAFTELLVDRCAPAHVLGVDPSPEQLAYARQRHTACVAEFALGEAMALPLTDASVDAATMGLVIFFVPDPGKGVAEMARVTRPGGTVSAYAWDLVGGGFPWDVVEDAMKAVGVPTREPPSAQAANLEVLQHLWSAAGLVSVATREITVERVFPDFDDFWETATLLPGVDLDLASLSAATVAGIKGRVRAAVHMEGGKVVHTARANAVKGVRPT